MDFGEKDVKKISIILIVGVLFVLAFLIIRPFIVAILSGLLLAYVFNPLYKKINRYIGSKSVAASIVVGVIVLGLIAILWFAAPILIKQAFGLFVSLQKLNMEEIITKVFPTASSELISQLANTLNSATSKAFAVAANYLSNFITELPQMLLNFFILGFVFFFSLRDSGKLIIFMRGISPLNDAKEKVVVKHFEDMTSAVIYGWVIVGIIQGTLAGIGFFMFGVQNALILTLVAIFFSIIPFLGPMFVWIPVGIYMATTGATTPTLIAFLLYNVLIVSLVDNILRSYIVSKRTNVPSAVVLIGMIGGLVIFGIAGLVIGPLILAYLLTLLDSFKDKSIYALFS